MFYNCEERKLIGLIIQAITRTIDHFDRQTVAPSAVPNQLNRGASPTKYLSGPCRLNDWLILVILLCIDPNFISAAVL